MLDILKVKIENSDMLKTWESFNNLLNTLSNKARMEELKTNEIFKYLELQEKLQDFRNLWVEEKIRLVTEWSLKTISDVEQIQSINEANSSITNSIIWSLARNQAIMTSDISQMVEWLNFSLRDKENLKRQIQSKLEQVWNIS
jgi:predicted nucleotidyltransferase